MQADERPPADCPAGDAGMPAAATAERVTCALCGASFLPSGAVCANCPLHSGCRLVRCPRCGFGVPERSRWVEWIRKICGGRWS